MSTIPRKLVALAACGAAALGYLALTRGTFHGGASTIDPAASLLITAPAILDSPAYSPAPCSGGPPGPYSFAGLVGGQVSGPSLKTWLLDRVKEHVTGQREAILAAWQNCGGAPSADTFPFRALAIVNRIDSFDLEKHTCGELRFVFSAYRTPDSNNATVTDLYAIVEFTIACPAYRNVVDWGKEWTSFDSGTLASKLPGSLHGWLSRAFSWRVRTLSKPNLADWQFEQFGPQSNALAPAPLTQTPSMGTNDGSALTAQIAALPTDAAFDKATYQPPTNSFTTDSSFLWMANLYGKPGDKRFKFSIRTCSGCHQDETHLITDSDEFVQIAHRERGQPSALSPYLTGRTVTQPCRDTPSQYPCPAVSEPARRFEELAQRQRILLQILNAKSDADLAAIPRTWVAH